MEKPTVREQLIRGSLAYFADGGSRDLSVRAIAAASGRSTMCVYSKFGSRQGLLEAVFERAAEELLEAVDKEPSTAALQDWAAARPELYGLLFEHDLGVLGIDPERRRDAVSAILASLARSQGGNADRARELFAAAHGAIALARLTAQV